MSALQDAFDGDLFPLERRADLTLTVRFYGHISPALLDDAKEQQTTLMVELMKRYKLDGGTVELDNPSDKASIP